MTDFAKLVQADRGQPAFTLHVVDAAGLPGWLGQQGERVQSGLEALRFKGKADEVAVLPYVPGAWTIVAGVADAARLGAWDLAAAAAKLPAGEYRVAGGAPGGAALGWLLAQHRFDRYKRDEGGVGPRVLLTPGPADEAVALAEATALVRDLVDTPAGDMGPDALAEAILGEGRRFGAEVKVIKGEALIDAGYPAVHAVGRASATAPRLIDLVWGDPAHPKLSLVGKGVTFDSGGLDIKPASGMALMKKDMGGAAHALALARLVMGARLPVRLRLIVPAVENAISGNAFRPGDVLATRKGLSVEIGNTDAEGRLILADALAAAGEDAPALLLDFATLTGAARVALGPDLPALFSNDEALAADWLAAGVAVDDPLWRLPLWAPYRDMFKSAIADLNNSGEGGFAGAITAALFLERFVPANVPWAHVDLFAWRPAAKPGRPKGGDAMSLRAAFAMLRRRFI